VAYAAGPSAAAAKRPRLLHANEPFRRQGFESLIERPGILLADLMAEVAHSGEASRACLQLGESHWFDVHAFPLPALGSGDPAIGLKLRDISDHRGMVERLIGLRRITTVCVISWGAGFRLVAVNDGFLRMTGFTHDEAIGKTWQDLTPLEHHAASWEAVRQVTTLGEAVPYEKEYFRRDGSRWWGLFAPRKIGDEVIEFVLDVSERIHAETALRAADRRKDEFLATLAHELRNPLAPIKNGVQLLRLTTAVDARNVKTLDMVDRQLNLLVRLVDDLLDVARLTSGKVRLRWGVVSLRDVVLRSVEGVQSRLEAKGHALRLELVDDVLVAGDADRLTQVFANLLNNAVKYTGPRGEIGVAMAIEPDWVSVIVTDTGIGIPAEQQSAVFDSFTQLDGHHAGSEGGLGIGLALVDGLVRLHGGSVHVHSEGVNRGSCFRVRLPRVQARPAGPSPLPAASAQVRKLRILVADDNVDAAESLAMLLRSDGHEVVTAHDGQQAVDAARAFHPQVAFLDVGMPVKDGLSAASEIRADRRLAGIRLVALTGWGQASDREKTAAAGFHLHLVKPLSPHGLEAALAIASSLTPPH
jgi:PAS domain S-box-containing protein